MRRIPWLAVILLASLLITLCACSTSAGQSTPAPTEAPIVEPTPHIMGNPNIDQKYLSLAQGGLATPIQRPGLRMGLLPDAWKVELLAPEEMQVTMPLSVGTPEQTVRLGKVAIAQVTEALFDNAPELTRVTVIGTTPDGPDGAELPAISIVVERAAFAQWDGAADNLGPWQVSERLQ
jgi:hypothetical protein